MDNSPITSARRARPLYRVFVSSTWADLQPERKALMEALNRMEEMRFVGMEFFGNRPDDTHDASIDQVDQCEVLVGIIGFRYGSGITEAEYRRARKLGLPCFVYFKRADLGQPDVAAGDPALAAKLAAFKQDLLRDHTVKEFNSPEELAANATADLHNWVAARWITLERETPAVAPAPVAPPDADRTNILRLLERIQHDWVEGVLEASLHHRAWLELGLDWKENAVEHPWDRIVVAANRPIQTLSTEDTITSVFTSAQNTLLVLGEPGAGKTTTLLELARDLIKRARQSPIEPAPVVLALSTWTGTQRDFAEWLVAELGLRYQVPKRIAQAWLDDARLVLLLDGLDEVQVERRAACVEAINAFEQTHHPPGLAVTCRVAEYEALSCKLRLRAAICLQPLTPGQIERYFAAAGAGLEHLRVAMREDEGLRELARTPLMLSVMTMAWRNAPAGGLGPAGAGTIEQRRQQLFVAYVHAALNRHGKSAGGYSSEQTVGWLTWLAQRMKEQGHTLFAVEQLQPVWLGSAAAQFGYFLSTRLLGTFGLGLPFLLSSATGRAKLMLAALMLITGLAIGGVDFGFAWRGWGGTKRASNRFNTLFFGFVIGGFGWILGVAQLGYNVAGVANLIAFYLFMAGFAFCLPLDVRAMDVKPSASMRWSWQQALERGQIGLVATNVGLWFIALSLLGFGVIAQGWKRTWLNMFGDGYFIGGFAFASVAIVVAWIRLQPRRSPGNLALALSFATIGGIIGMAIKAGSEIGSWFRFLLLFELVPAIAMGVFGGFASTLIDPACGRHAGVWFWLRIPTMLLLFVGLVSLLPGLIWIGYDWNTVAHSIRMKQLWTALAFAAGCGLVAFFRFGGFNGVQHFFLRWLLVRSGHLPAKPEVFFNHAAKLALLQKVGFGYRFIHALLLDHLAARTPASEAKATQSPSGN